MALLSDNIRLQRLLVFCLPLLLYANTLGHDFVLDDTVTLTQNRFVQAGLSGIPEIFSKDTFAGYLPEGVEDNPVTGGRYRPLSLIFFAVLVQFFGTNSIVFHLFSVLLYSLTCLLLYNTLRLALHPLQGGGQSELLALGTTILFAVHPVHTEVVANVKSCDEQMALLAGLGVIYAVLKVNDTGRWTWALAAAASFFAACLAKENAAALLILAPLALFIFRKGLPTPSVSRRLLLIVLPLVLAFGLWIGLRGMALDWHFESTMTNDPLNNPFLKSDGKQWVPFAADEKAATILYTLFQYARLMVWPYPLTHDYYPFQIKPQSFAQAGVLAGIGVYALLLLAGLGGIWKRKLFALGIWWYLLPLLIVANIFFPVGTFMAERFLFMPSFGVCFVLAMALIWVAGKVSKWRIPALALVIGIAAIWGITTILRNGVWADNKQLLQTDLANSPESAKLRYTLGNLLLTEALAMQDTARRGAILQEAFTHLKRALELHPSYYDALLAYGACTFYLQLYEQSVAAYRTASRMNPEDDKNTTGLTYALRYGGEYYARKSPNVRKAIGYLTESWQLNPDTATATILAGQYEALGQVDQALQWMEKAAEMAPNDPRLLQTLMTMYASAGETAKAAEVEKRIKSFAIFAPATPR